MRPTQDRQTRNTEKSQQSWFLTLKECQLISLSEQNILFVNAGYSIHSAIITGFYNVEEQKFQSTQIL